MSTKSLVMHGQIFLKKDTKDIKITAMLVHKIHTKSLTPIKRLCRERASLAIEIRACESILEQKVTQRIKTSYVLVNNSTHKDTQITLH